MRGWQAESYSPATEILYGTLRKGTRTLHMLYVTQSSSGGSREVSEVTHETPFSKNIKTLNGIMLSINDRINVCQQPLGILTSCSLLHQLPKRSGQQL